MKFTGKKGDRYYYKGHLWLGPSNRIGDMPNGAELIPETRTNPETGAEHATGLFGLYPRSAR
jgi:hypothetical protein